MNFEKYFFEKNDTKMLSGILPVICYNGTMQKKVIYTENTPYGLIEVEDILSFTPTA